MDTAGVALPRKRPQSLALQVTLALSERIRNGVYKPGDQLPVEQVIMAEQGVSRTIVREAVSRLQAAGLVQTRHGVGTFVLSPGAPQACAFDLPTVLTIRDVLEMLELRISLETEAAGLAAMRRTDAQLALMTNAVAAFEAGIERGESAVDADFEFHLQIALATQNRYFEDFYRHLGKTTIPRTRIDTWALTQESGPSYLLRTNREHQYILEAIERKDPQAASAGMRMHLSNSIERLRRARQ
jgi:DNA-binding FadR family transcriptional regulator